jgi:hypothetical protein
MADQQTSLTIHAHGPPPEKNADRVVAEMLRLIVKARSAGIEQIKHALATTPDGNPRAQLKLAKSGWASRSR